MAVAFHDLIECGHDVVALGQVDLGERHVDVSVHHLDRLMRAIAHKRGP